PVRICRSTAEEVPALDRDLAIKSGRRRGQKGAQRGDVCGYHWGNVAFSRRAENTRPTMDRTRGRPWIRDIVVHSGASQLRQWVRERRNVVDDFRKAFGRELPAAVEVLALFTDNDQTMNQLRRSMVP